MEKMNALTLIITLVVGVILTGALLGPVIGDATATEKTLTNEGICSMAAFDDQSNISLSWDHTNPEMITVNGETIALPQPTGIPLSIIASDAWGVRYLVQNDSVLNLTLFDGTASTKFSVLSTGTEDLLITLSEGTATFTHGENSITETYEQGYYIAKEGEYVMKNPSETAYLKGDSTVYSTGRTGGLSSLTPQSNVNLHLQGTIDGGIEVTSLYPPAYTTSDVIVNAVADSKYIDLYKFDNVTFTVIDSGSNTGTAVYSQVIVPASVTAELSDHLTPGQISLMGAIPVMVIVALLMAAVGAIALRRAD